MNTNDKKVLAHIVTQLETLLTQIREIIDRTSLPPIMEIMPDSFSEDKESFIAP